MKHLPAILILTALAVYMALFYAAELPSVTDDSGHALRRIEVSLQLALRPDELLLPGWFGSPPQFALLDRLPVLLVAAAILSYASSLGWLVMMLCNVSRGLTRLETFVFATAVGLNLVSTYVLAVGLLGLLGNWPVFAVLPAVLTLAAAATLYWRRRRQSSAEVGHSNTLPQPPQGDDLRLSPHWLWLGLPFVLIVILGGMLPPVDFDVREYHLQVPKEFFQQGQITFLPHNVYGNMALGTEMLSLLAMELVGRWWLGALIGKTVIAAMTPLTALALLAAGRRFFSPSAGIVAALVYLSIPWITSISAGGLVEGASACYLLLTVYALLLWQGGDRRLLLLAGYLAGGAVAIKYPAALFVVVPSLVWVLVVEMKTGTGRSLGKSLVVFLLAVVLGCGLWFGKNWVLTGNPSYPLLYEVFGGKSWTPEKNRQWNHVHRPHDFSLAALGGDLGKVAGRSEWLSPLLLPLAALALLGRGRSRRLAVVLLAYFAGVIAAWWLFTHRIDRFWIPALSLVALAAGAGACFSLARWWRVVLIALLLVGLGANFLVAAAGYNHFFVPLDRLRHDPARVDPWHAYFNRHATAGRVLMVGDAPMFDLEVPVLYNTCFDNCLFEQLAKRRTAGQVRAELAARGITHVYVHWGEIARYRRTRYGFTDFAQPKVFKALVAGGVLRPLKPIEGHPGRAYQVILKDGG